jgi:hypothetical protein
LTQSFHSYTQLCPDRSNGQFGGHRTQCLWETLSKILPRPQTPQLYRRWSKVSILNLSIERSPFFDRNTPISCLSSIDYYYFPGEEITTGNTVVVCFVHCSTPRSHNPGYSLEHLPVPYLIRSGHTHIFLCPQSKFCNLNDDAPLLYNYISANFERKIFSNCTFANSIFISDPQLQVRDLLKCCSTTVYPQFRIIYKSATARPKLESDICNFFYNDSPQLQFALL